MNRQELLADVRDAFDHLEEAISQADAGRCRDFVTTKFYEQVLRSINELDRAGRRRVHGSFDIVAADVMPPQAGSTGMPEMRVLVRACSTLMEVDRAGKLQAGSDELTAWSQEVLAEQDQRSRRWVIAGLGQMSIQGPLQGAAGQPLAAPPASELEQRERESIEHANAVVASALNFLSVQYPRG